MRTATKVLVAALAVTGAILGAGAPSASAAACDEIVANGYGFRQPNAGHVYYLNPATFEADDRHANVVLSIAGGADTWNNELTDCWHLRQNPDRVEHFTGFAGFTALRANAQMADGQHTIDFGTFANQPEWGECSQGGRLACAIMYVNPLRGTQIIDADIRFDVWWDWYDGRNGGDAFNAAGWNNCGQYDLWGVAAHEIGHTLGFNHVSGPNQTMYASAAPCSISLRTLGAADLYGYRAYYANPQDP
jgi:hypothetical protein